MESGITRRDTGADINPTDGYGVGGQISLKLAIMQPYFFPYIGYFHLIQKSDLFVVFDTAQFPRRSWVSRNRILNRETHWSFISIPVEKRSFVNGQQTAIQSVEISNHLDWRELCMLPARNLSRKIIEPTFLVLRNLKNMVAK